MAIAAQGLKDKLGGLTELKRRLLFVLIGIIVFRIGSHVPVPGLDPQRLADFFNSQKGGVLGLFNMFSGGALSRLTIFALGVMPYISASIIIQLFTSVSPKLEQLKKEGESGRRKINQYTRYGTLILAIFQAIGIARWLTGAGIVLVPGAYFYFVATITLATGTMFLMWLGEQMTERGIGNGISLIIFSGIVSRFPSAIGGVLSQVRQGQMQVITLFLLIAIIVVVTGFVVFVERGQRRISVNYARRQVGNKIYAAQTSHLPLKVNMAGVIPPIFASSIILFPATLAQWFGHGKGMGWLNQIGLALTMGQPLYMISYAAAIIFFCFFYTALVFNPKETAENLKKSGAFIPGIRPGLNTASYIDLVMTRLTLFGAVYITAVSLLPDMLMFGWNMPFYFGGTSLLIVVVVLMDFMAQIQSHLLSHQYDSLLKKAKLKGGSMLGR
ncbi:MAG: preprotein translocase subunit SecY [Gammaproteobacteria bacterium GWE2_37_16]|nr:MAG: preprotein translocase subunit SecY [Gammaproteobacteria bacterium GWE2_37_16]